MTIEVDSNGKSLWFNLGVDLLDSRTPFVEFFPFMAEKVGEAHDHIKPVMLRILPGIVKYVPRDESISIQRRRFCIHPGKKDDWKKLLPEVIRIIQVEVNDQVGIKVLVGPDWPLTMLGKVKPTYKPRPKK